MDLTVQFNELNRFMEIFGSHRFALVFETFSERLIAIARESNITPGELFDLWMKDREHTHEND